MTRLKAIKTFFELDGGRKITTDEIKALTEKDKQELGELACKELGVPLTTQEV